ncbi:PTS system, ascorbate-specific IIB component [Williamsoniiplasma luminosum]|uniref:PTS system, ascorbate-specific IIB component n=2 Tax=Williamsoniiplasma luminosum TaxID=214888 RepID=A0A2K8NWL8_9MOLU|nr:PTS system, ascorbate-specific IIB component [Williamsoniiplasma luminosum]
MAVCGMGLGSSLIIEMNIKDVTEQLDIDCEVGHTNLNSFIANDSSITAVICGSDLADSIEHPNKIILQNLFDKEEIKEKISKFMEVYE